MPLLTDSTYLRTQQYQDSASLRARASLHERFSTNSQGRHPHHQGHELVLACPA